MRVFLAAGAVVAILAAGLSARAQGTFVSAVPGNAFFADQPVRFTCTGGPARVTVEAIDYSGHSVRKGDYPAGAITLGRLPRGWYTLRSSSEAVVQPTAFVVIPHPERRGEGRVATDAALSWLVAPAHVDEAAALIERAGVRWVRDRIAWPEVEPARGNFVWGKYDSTASVQSRHGLSISDVFHATPKWARADGAPNRFPDDLRDVYQFARAAGRHFHGRVKAWEAWNEADIPVFSADPASDYAAFLKAAYLGFKAADSALPVTQVSFALPADRFGADLIANGANDYYDIFNYHIYDDPTGYAKRAQGHLARILASGAAGRPVWVTEAGIPLRALGDTLSEEEQRRQAEFIPKSYVESFVHGTDRHFFFILPHYLENGVEFGLLNSGLKPYPGYAALATLANALGEAKYLGEIRFRQPGLHVHLFDSGDHDTLAAWTDSGEAILPLEIAPGALKRSSRLVVRDLVGAPAALNKEIRQGIPRIVISPAPIYVTLPRGMFAGAITPPAVPAPPTRPLPGKRFARLRILSAAVDRAAEAYRVPGGQPATIELQVYNFDSRRFTGQAAVSAPTGWTLSRGTIQIEDIAPMGMATMSLSLTPASGAHGPVEIKAALQSDTGQPYSPAVITVVAD